ncbi:PREDICTED: ras-related protein Rab-20 [Nanorana parkeri]|uniref:ras-related protein Rab-20 n=1 Tax=Nanorana parkeri TaxID=125878 RepID=UPI00085480F9|nr:PREDICTED: ras-related protein Rab-20 [Nanorana parkeri]
MAGGSMMKKPDLKVVLLGDMNVGKTSLLHRYMERRFQDTVSTVGGAFYLKQWGPYNISIWDTAGREQFHGLGSMYCRSASAIILTYDVSNMQSLLELEDRFLGLTDTASDDCLFAVVGNKVDLTDDYEGDREFEEERPRTCSTSKVRKQVQSEDAIGLYKRIMKYRMVDENHAPAAEKMCFETSAKTGHNVDVLFESVFNMVIPLIVKKKANGPEDTVNLAQSSKKQTKSGCC